MTINLLKIKLSREPAQGVKQNPRRLETSRKTQTWFLACPQKSFTVLRFCSHIITFHKHTIIGVWLKSCWTRIQVAPVKLRAAGTVGRWAGPQSPVRILPLRLLHRSSRLLTSFASFLQPKLPNTKSRAQTTKQQLFPSTLGFGYYFLNSYLTLQAPRKGALVLFSVSLQTTTLFWDHLCVFQSKMRKRQAEFSPVPYKLSLPWCAEPLHPKLRNCLELHLGKNHHHPAERAHLG